MMENVSYSFLLDKMIAQQGLDLSRIMLIEDAKHALVQLFFVLVTQTHFNCIAVLGMRFVDASA